MTQSSLPNYAQFEALIEKDEFKMHSSQIHGVICGLFSGNPNTPATWEELVMEGKSDPQIEEMLRAMKETTTSQLAEFLFELEMLLPDDEAALPLRAEALTLWCQGFLTGLKIAEVQVEARKPSELTEAINDIIEIARMNYEQVVASEEDEEAYAELVEFVRMAVILVYQDLREEQSQQQPKTSLNPLH